VPVAPSSLINVVGREQIGQTNTDSSARLNLLDRFALISDPRSARGRRHCLASILAIVACATVAVGGDCLTAIQQWADNAPQQVLADLHIWRAPFTGLHRPPSERTIRRVLAALDGDELDACLATFLNRSPAPPAAETPDRLPAPASRRTEREARRAAHRSPTPIPELLPAYAVDGKRLKGARHPDGGRVHLISLAAHLDATVHAQRQIPAKSSEIAALDALLRQARSTDLAGAIITTDALHTQRASARLLIEEHHAHYIMIVKANQCATRRSDASPPKAGQTRREVCWVRWLTRSRKAKGTRACQETGGRVQVPGTARRGTRTVWRRLDCLNPNLQRQHFTATGTAPETGARRGRGVLVRPGHPSRRERCPMRAFKEMSGAPGPC